MKVPNLRGVALLLLLSLSRLQNEGSQPKWELRNGKDKSIKATE